MTDRDAFASERRGARRHPAELEVQYRSVGRTRVHSTRDLSVSGVFLSCEEPVPLGTRLELALDADVEPSLALQGEVVRVVWGGRDRGRPIAAGMAVRFVGQTDAQRAGVSALIQRLAG